MEASRSQSDLVEKMLEVHLEFLNAHHASDKGYEPITRDMYDLELTDDHPTIFLDVTLGDTRLIRLQATPFHDEGGPAMLTAQFTQYYSLATGFRRPAEWSLDFVIHEFDTYVDFIYNQGAMQSMPEKEDAT